MTMSLCARRFLVVLCLLSFSIYLPNVFAQVLPLEITKISIDGHLGGNATLSCLVRPGDAEVAWTFGETPISLNNTRFKVVTQNVSMPSDIDGNRRHVLQSSLLIEPTSHTDHGDYFCHASLGDEKAEKKLSLSLALSTRLTTQTVGPVKLEISKTAILNCIFEGFNLAEVKWRKMEDYKIKFPPENVHSAKLNETHINGTIKIPDVNRKDNGTYLCGCRDVATNSMITGAVDILVLDKPQISIDFIKAVGAKQIYVNWTVNDGNAPIESYNLQYRKNGTETWTYYSTPISGGNTSFVMSGLVPSNSYQLKILGKNSQGWGPANIDTRWIKTLEEDPHFVPVIEVKGYTVSSMTIGWVPPPENLTEYIHFYELSARETNTPEGSEKQAIHSGDYRNLPYMFDNLTPDTNYTYKVRSCSELTRECGQWSSPVYGSTMDGVSGPPNAVTVACRHDNVSGSSFVYVAWQPPTTPNGKIIRYNVEVSGNASFMNSEGIMEFQTWGPKMKHIIMTARHTRFDTMPANTNFTVKVSAVTRTKRGGEQVSVQCATPPATPPRDSLQGFRWDKVREYDGRWMFRLYLPRVSERNGAICCYRVFLVRMKNDQRLSDMPSPEHLAVSSYKDVHNGKQGAGAYIAEIFTSTNLHSEVILGDGSAPGPSDVSVFRQCVRCAGSALRPITTTTAVPITTTAAPPVVNSSVTTAPLAEIAGLTIVPDLPANEPALVEIPGNIVNIVEEPEKDDVPIRNIVPLDKIAENSVTQIPEAEASSTSQSEDVYSSTEKMDSNKKKKKKTKRYYSKDIIVEPEHDYQSSSALKTEGGHSLQDMNDYQSMQRDAPAPMLHFPVDRESQSSYNGEQKFILDDDFFITQRIYRQNRLKPNIENYENNPTSDGIDDAVSNEDLKDVDDDDAVWDSSVQENNDDIDVIDFGTVPKDNTLSREYLGKHKIIVKRQTDREFDQLITERFGPRKTDYMSNFRNTNEEEEEDSDFSSKNLYNGRFGGHFKDRLNSIDSFSYSRGEKWRNKHFGKHSRIAKRQVESSDFVKLMKDLVGPEGKEVLPNHRGEKSLSEGSPINSNHGKVEFNERLKKLQEQKEKRLEAREEVVDLSKMNVNDESKPDLVDFGSSGSGDAVFTVFDGQLDIDSNYTGFVELLVHSESSVMMPVYSDYFSVLNPGPDDVPNSDSVLLSVLKIVVGCVVVALLLALALCAAHAYGRRKARHQGAEAQTLQMTLRNIYQGLKGGRHQLVSHNPPDMPPIAKDNLLAAYNERQNDSGYGFQREFELLPDSFPDRTMEASEAKENLGKNRYPDIKAYDQTRVKLSQMDSIVGSDYINANVVLGYKEQKKFICAQGPTDVTVNDFWRMIWEYNLELVVMLTNLEEYSKVKCSKYWPDQKQQEKTYDNIVVQHLGEKRYSDYIIRELKISKSALTNSNSNSQIIEINGVKKNGVNECSNGNGTASGANDERIVKQYHFLMWKDFVAPEHPYTILKFIKRVNEACGVGRSALVHCSAGVGRTGTLVALDCLLQQLQAEGHVAVFNTVCDLRRQRNFLVQSLKQYVFVYRALLEFAQYGDTEIPASRLRTSVDRLRQTAENTDTCAMENEFEKLKQPLIEMLKPCSAGRAPENVAKNRSELVLPYDHNRVILSPIPTKENSTYINSSFIEGYDNAESYIITQDPLTSTIADFWRMVSEQEITTIVMLSELGDGDKKCPRYWDDDVIQYEHISVSYLQSESCPYYTKREFEVTNTKNQEHLRVTQLQYHGWPTVAGQVPEVTRGIIELVGQSGPSPPSQPPLLVHCSLGTDRSSMFVALSILIAQLRTEKRVDVSTVTRKMRTQRMGCLDTFLQYEFLHRAIVNYAELHNLLTDS